MIKRRLETKLRELAGYYPVVLVTGPRQSGKTTLCRAVFPDRPDVLFEALDTREYARADPRGFLAEYADGAILDEVQQVRRSRRTTSRNFTAFPPARGVRGRKSTARHPSLRR